MAEGEAGMRHRSDHTQEAIIDALRRIGVQVVCVGEPLDLLCAYRSRTLLLECKNGKGVTTKAQAEFMKVWTGEYHIVRTPEEAIRAVIGDEVLR